MSDPGSLVTAMTKYGMLSSLAGLAYGAVEYAGTPTKYHTLLKRDTKRLGSNQKLARLAYFIENMEGYLGGPSLVTNLITYSDSMCSIHSLIRTGEMTKTYDLDKEAQMYLAEAAKVIDKISGIIQETLTYQLANSSDEEERKKLSNRSERVASWADMYKDALRMEAENIATYQVPTAPPSEDMAQL
jgi:hypothetical protein